MGKKRKNFTALTKLKALAPLAKCKECGKQFESLSDIEFDHIIMDAMGGDNTVDNCAPLCKECHEIKTDGRGYTTYGSDKHIKAKDDRLNGRTKTGPKKPIQNRGFQTNRGGEYKATFAGTKRREPAGR